MAVATARIQDNPADHVPPLELGTLPQPLTTIGRHAALARIGHDARARLDTHAHLNHLLAQAVVPRLERQFAAGAKAAAPQTRADAWRLMEQDPRFGIWSRLRRSSMEQRQNATMEAVLADRDRLAETCRALSDTGGNLRLDPSLPMPLYLEEIHAHLQPGGYVTERGADDVTAGAAYEVNLYSTIAGRSGPRCDGAGRAVARWLQTNYPDLAPRRIFDLGCGAGLNTVAIASAFPQAEVVAIDAAAPMLRYAAARAQALGVQNIRFVQANIEAIPADLGNADLTYTTIVLHETSYDAVRAIFRQCRERTRAGGLSIHVEQPPYADKPLFEQVMRDWDGRYNDEAFWSGLYELDLTQELIAAGFAADRVFTGSVSAVPWRIDPRAPGKLEDYGRTGNWQVVGARP
jgi:SAM-dependent methyltransferase